jgi:beta-lactam-binding protein with PASTA domain/predicted Ser/Thr protein kinase
MTEVANETVVDGRYRVLERLGSGGMADVYGADDSQLGRKVALKILHRRFARDDEFVKRFQREASSAAALQHPNVVNVFDRGEHDGTYYIAMEFLPGRTLKEVVSEDAPLSEVQAIDYTLQILDAAAFAHKRGVIHRDLKPHNVIVSPDGAAKVTDFGIARAGASEMTETGSIMGTAQYLSPEQAQGHGVTAASDLYSIGILLYELLTGQVPFGGDTAVSIALKHVSEPVPPVSQLRPDVHPVLEAIVMRALVKDPGGRFASAEEFADALKHAREAIVSGTDGGGTAAFFPVAPPAPEPEPERGRRWRLWAAILAVLLIAGGALAFALTRPAEVAVPSVVGDEVGVATEKLGKAGFDVAVERQRNVAPADTVFRQDPGGTNPAPGLQADEGSTVTLFVSNGPGERRVPAVEGKPRSVAVRELNDAGFSVDLDEEPSRNVSEGLATRTVPGAGREAEIGSRVRLFISSGLQQVEVPNVVGLSRENAESQLEADGLSPAIVEEESDAPKGEVISQSPVGGQRVAEGTRVEITVSKGRKKVAVPSVVGLSQSAARSRLSARGFEVRVREVDAEPGDDGTVLRQSPGGGSRQPEGSTVTIFVGNASDTDGEEVPEDPPEPQPIPDEPGASLEPGAG